MAEIGFALFAAHLSGSTIQELAKTLDLPVEWITERIEAARLCLL